MRRLLAALFCAVLLWATSADAQSQSARAPLTSTTCPGTGCVLLSVSGAGGVAVQVTGTFVGTLTFEGSIDGVNYVALGLLPIADTTAVTTTTTTGLWSGGVGGMAIVRVRMSAYTSGTATVSIQNAPTSSRSVGGGGGTISGTIADTQIAFGTAADTIGGSADLTWDGSTLSVASDTESARFYRQATLTPDGNYADTVLPSYFKTTVNPISNQTSDPPVFSVEADVFLEGSHDIWRAETFSTLLLNHNSGSLDFGLFGNDAYFENTAGGSVGTVIGFYSDARNSVGGNIDLLQHFYINGLLNDGTITTAEAFYVGAMGGGATNAYSFWSDEQGVFRIKSDNTFNAVYQAIPALYNPQFTKYTPGAADFERCIPGCQWESNVAVITTEAGAGGGNVLRGMRIGDAGVPVQIATDTGVTLIYSTETTAPSAPSANGGVIFLQDNGAGKSQFCARFNTGAVQCFATEP